MALRETLNQANPNLLPTALQGVPLGELLVALIAGMTPTEAGVVPAAHVATLAATPSAVFQVNATAGGVTGIKELLKGPITGDDAIVPATGQCVWDGGIKILFAAADAVTATSVTYVVAATKASVLLRDIDEQT